MEPVFFARRLVGVPPHRPLSAIKIVVGERWGCAGRKTEAGPEWQCWDADPAAAKAGRPPHAWKSPWVSELAGHPATILASVDRVCAFDDGRFTLRCWQRPTRSETSGIELPSSAEWLNPHHLTRDDPDFVSRLDFVNAPHVGGTFACVAGSPSTAGLFCVGDDDFGQRGIGPGVPADADVSILRVGAGTVALGVWHGCALPANSCQTWCWGRGDHGQLGVPPRDRCHVGGRDVPCARAPQPGPAAEEVSMTHHAIVSGDLYSCLGDLRGILCWGANRDAFFGDRGSCPPALRRAWPTLHGTESAPNAACPARPVRLSGVHRAVERLAAGPRGLCFSVDGAVHCLGAVPSPRGADSPPTSIEPDGQHILGDIAVSPGEDASACALPGDGTVECWGDGYSSPDAPDVPVRVDFEAPTSTSEVAIVGPFYTAPWADDCVIQRGCTLTPANLPLCTFHDASPTWSELASSADSLSGKVVRVRGRLGLVSGIEFGTGCGSSDGKKHCCDQVSSFAVLAGEPRPLALDGLFCSGDESVECCNVPAYGAEVVARGRLTASVFPDFPRGPGAWRLTEVTLCVDSNGH